MLLYFAFNLINCSVFHVRNTNRYHHFNGYIMSHYEVILSFIKLFPVDGHLGYSLAMINIFAKHFYIFACLNISLIHFLGLGNLTGPAIN